MERLYKERTWNELKSLEENVKRVLSWERWNSRSNHCKFAQFPTRLWTSEKFRFLIHGSYMHRIIINYLLNESWYGLWFSAVFRLPCKYEPVDWIFTKIFVWKNKKEFPNQNKHNKIINIGFDINRIYSWFNNCRWVSIVSSCTKLESATYSCHLYLGETWEWELSINHKLWLSNAYIFSTHCRRL